MCFEGTGWSIFWQQVTCYVSYCTLDSSVPSTTSCCLQYICRWVNGRLQYGENFAQFLIVWCLFSLCVGGVWPTTAVSGMVYVVCIPQAPKIRLSNIGLTRSLKTTLHCWRAQVPMIPLPIMGKTMQWTLWNYCSGAKQDIVMCCMGVL